MKSEPKPNGLRVEEVRERLSEAGDGPAYWRSLEELAQTDEFHELLEREFPTLLPLEQSQASRRRFLQFMGASLALAGLSACSLQPEERILPYTKQPEEIVPGKPLYFASAHPNGPFGRGILVESHMGRPTKIEGNPDHPSSLGATDLFDQASILELYDPDRMRAPSYLSTVRSWEAFAADLGPRLEAQRALGGEGLRVVLPNTTSPTVLHQIGILRQRFPKARFVAYESAGSAQARAGFRAAFGRPVHVHYDLSEAEVLVCLDHDLLTEGPGSVRYARDFARRRRIVDGHHEMNRLYAVESSPTSTGQIADHRLPLSPVRLEGFVLALAAALGVEGVHAQAEPELQTWVDAVAADLRTRPGRSLVSAGDSLRPELHTIVMAINDRLNNIGRTVLLQEPVLLSEGSGLEALRELTTELRDGKVDLLLLLGGNPAQDTPADLDFASAAAEAGLRVRFSSHDDETAEFCQWKIPLSHPLESWGDIRGHDGTVAIVQPLIAPLFASRSVVEILEFLAGDPTADGLAVVRRTWTADGVADLDDKAWRRALHDGLVRDAEPAALSLRVAPATAAAAAASLAGTSASACLVIRPDPTVGDGRFANNGWLQECPKPHTRITWDNALLLAPRTAEKLGVSNEELVLLRANGRQMEVAAWILPGHAEDTFTLHLGYGRRRAGRVGNGCGFDANRLRTVDSPWRVDGVEIEPLGRRYRLASTQLHANMEGRDLIRHSTVAELEHGHGQHTEEGHHLDPNASLMPGFTYEGYKWGMTVDLSTCTGCNACVIACQSENNISIVGKDEVLNGREMHWMRIDRYFEGDLDQPTTYLQPVMCQHCEQAPCEVVCPVSATVHTDEGINAMAYNRCVGTRYCANNCPYKVRRFNFYQYADYESDTLKLMRNPDVTIRHRGVMEKCNYCLQRVNHAKIEATVRDLPLAEVGLQSACQQACPTAAIEFGDLNDSEAPVTQWAQSDLAYGILTDLGTRPRTSYLQRVSNPNPELARS